MTACMAEEGKVTGGGNGYRAARAGSTPAPATLDGGPG